MLRECRAPCTTACTDGGRRLIRTLSWLLVVVGCSNAYAQIGYYKFTVAAADAKVFLNDREIRKTAEFIFSGATLEGKYKLKVTKKGFNDFEQEIRIRSDELLEMSIELEYAEVLKTLPRRPERVFMKEESGKFILLSDPPGQPVRVDTLSWDQTPIILVDYPAGPHRVTIGNGVLNLVLPPYGIKRLLLENQVIREANSEIKRPEHGPVKLEAAQIAFSNNPADLENWKTAKLPKYPQGGMAEPIFKIDEEEWHLLCFLKFSNSSNDTVQFAQEFRIDNDDGEVHKHQAITRISPREKNHAWIYYTLRRWEPGYYSIKINDDIGPMAVIYFSLHY
jgi:hypothetical protein